MRAMKILAPAGSVDEVEMLIGSGAEELYCGLSPREWLEKYTMAVWLNRRGPRSGNLRTFAELRSLVDSAHSSGVPVFLTLNAPYYSAEQHPHLLEFCRRAEECGVAAFIISDLGLILALRDAKVKVPVHVSSVAATLNSSAVEFYRELGVTRVIFPRSLGVKDMGRIIQNSSADLEFEAFVLNDGCVYEEGFCHTTHNVAGAFCTTSWSYEWQADERPQPNGHREPDIHREPGQGRISSEAPEFDLEGHLADYRRWVWYINNCGCSNTPKGLPNGPCGLCAIPELAAMGISSLKIVGREANPYRKLAGLQLVKAVVDRVRAGMNPEKVRELAARIRETPELCSSGYMCYYR